MRVVRREEFRKHSPERDSKPSSAATSWVPLNPENRGSWPKYQGVSSALTVVGT